MIDSDEIAQRIKLSMEAQGYNMRSLADKCNLNPTGIRDIVLRKVKDPKYSTLDRIAVTLGMSVHELLYGEIKEIASPDTIKIPRYNAVVSAGYGAVNEENPAVVDHIPFTKEFLNKKLGKTSADGLFIVTTNGDSMEPTIGNDDLVLVDSHYRGKEAGLYAVNYGDETLVKRIQRIAGGYSLISDNTAYPPIAVQGQEAEQLQIIGKVLWISRVVGQR